MRRVACITKKGIALIASAVLTAALLGTILFVGDTLVDPDGSHSPFCWHGWCQRLAGKPIRPGTTPTSRQAG